jgi:transcriptional regulator with XRE-family HTH domain
MLKPFADNIQARLDSHLLAARLRKYAVKEKLSVIAVAAALGIPLRRTTVATWMQNGIAPRAKADIEMLETFLKKVRA